MKRGKVTKMGPGDFLRLATRCGLELSEVDLAQMARRKLIVPVERDNGESCYTELHLYVVAQYMRAVRPTRHPWATRGAKVTLDQVSTLAGDAEELIASALADERDQPSAEQTEFIVGVERFLARIDPFGPLANIFDLLQSQVIDEVRNTGRLYLEVKAAITELSARLHGASGPDAEEGEVPKTKQMFEVSIDDSSDSDELRSTQVIGGDEPPSTPKGDTPSAREAIGDAIDEVVSAASEASDANVEESSPEEVVELGSDEIPVVEDDDEEVDDGLFQNAAEATQIISVDEAEEESLAEETSEPIVLLEDDVTEEEEPESVEDGPSEQVQALDKRLEKFSEVEDESSDSEPDVEPDSEPDPDPEPAPSTSVPPPSPVERIAELNRRREVYMKEQSWDDLVALYEDGIGLFSDPDERQKIFLTLAMLYEVKLREKKKAFDTLDRAWAECETAEHRKKAFDGLQRLGKGSGLHEHYMEWLDEQLSKSLPVEIRVRLQKELALGLFADEKYSAAFTSYATFLSDEPERFVTVERLNQLERLGEHVDTEKVEGFFEELRQRELPTATRELIEEFAPEAAG